MARHAQIKIHPVKAAAESANAGSFYLTIVAANGETLATSELYVNQGNAARAEGDLLDAMRDIVAQSDAEELELEADRRDEARELAHDDIDARLRQAVSSWDEDRP